MLNAISSSVAASGKAKYASLPYCAPEDVEYCKIKASMTESDLNHCRILLISRGVDLSHQSDDFYT